MALSADVKRVLDILRTEMTARPAPTALGKTLTTAVDADAARTAIGAAAPGSTSVLTSTTLVTNYGAVSWSSMPAALTELKGNGASRTKVNLSGANKVRVTVAVHTAGYAGSRIAIQYATDGDTQAAWSDLDGASGPSVVIDSAGGKVSAWADVAAAAKGDVWLRVVGVDGNGTASPVIGSVVLQVDGQATAIAGATMITAQHGAPTGAITNPVLDLDAGLLYTAGSPAVAGSTTQILTATQQTMDSTTGWWFNTGTTMSGGKLTVPAASNAVLTVPATPGQTLRASVHVDSGADVFLTCLGSGGQQTQGYGTGDLVCPDYVVPAGVTSVDFNCEAYNATAVFDNVSVQAITAASGGYTTQTLGGGGGGNVTRVVYANGTYPTRPTTTTYVEWVGPVAPTSMQSGDTWTNTAA